MAQPLSGAARPPGPPTEPLRAKGSGEEDIGPPRRPCRPGRAPALGPAVCAAGLVAQASAAAAALVEGREGPGGLKAGLKLCSACSVRSRRRLASASRRSRLRCSSVSLAWRFGSFCECRGKHQSGIRVKAVKV